METKQIAYGGWENCLQLSNEYYDVIVTTDVGPRIIHFALRDGNNVLYQAADDMGKISGDEWRMYGGHRLWHAPEAKPRTYQADNTSVEHFELDNRHYFVPPLETATGLQKQISLSFRDSVLVVDHTFTNEGLWGIELAPWALTVMKQGGVSIVPLPPHVSHDTQLLPTHALTLWGYTALNDARLHFGDKYILVNQDAAAENPLKIGLRVSHDYLWSVGWLAYINQNTMFVKSFHPPETMIDYPDLGSQLEIFTDASIMELETLGGLVTLNPSESITHREYWSLHPDIAHPADDAQIGQDILPLIRQVHLNVGRRQTGVFPSLR